MDEALAWAKKGAISCDAPGEVRELLFFPDPQGSNGIVWRCNAETRRHGDNGTAETSPIRGEMFIESATSKELFLAPAERNMFGQHVPMTETLRSAGARVIELEVVSMKHLAPWSETNSSVALKLNSPVNEIREGLF